MYYYDGHIDDYLHKAMNGVITSNEFEEWLRSNKELLEHYLGEEEYYILISIEFTSENAENHVQEQARRIINIPTYEHMRISDMLRELIEQEEAYVRCCRTIYEDYCNGFRFFKIIALTSICYDYDHRLEQLDNMAGFIKEREFIVQEATEILKLLDSREIRIVETYYYLDRRKEGTHER